MSFESAVLWWSALSFTWSHIVKRSFPPPTSDTLVFTGSELITFASGRRDTHQFCGRDFPSGCRMLWISCSACQKVGAALRFSLYKGLVNRAPPFRLSYCPPSFPLHWFLFLLPLLPGTLGEREVERKSLKIDRRKGSVDYLLSK